MVELLKFITDPREKLAAAFRYLCRIHNDSDWSKDWAVELWLLIHGHGYTNISRCDLKDMKAMSEKLDLWMVRDGSFVSLADWRRMLDEAANG